MTMNLYDKTSLKCSKNVTNAYSTSFSLGIKVLARRFHHPIYAIYGFVRYADEIVDTFHQHDKSALLKDFRKATYLAISEKISLNPVLHSFQLVVNKYHIDHSLIEAFFESMAMDLEHISYDDLKYRKYIYGSAEVIGLMCLQVFCDGENQKFQELKEPARRLGAAFQKVNFLRDMHSDLTDLGRLYFPNVDSRSFDEKTKMQIEIDIKSDFQAALRGILQLPKGAGIGVYLAFIYYKKLFMMISKCSVSQMMKKRIRVSNYMKMWLMIVSFFKYKISVSDSYSTEIVSRVWQR